MKSPAQGSGREELKTAGQETMQKQNNVSRALEELAGRTRYHGEDPKRGFKDLTKEHQEAIAAAANSLLVDDLTSLNATNASL